MRRGWAAVEVCTWIRVMHDTPHTLNANQRVGTQMLNTYAWRISYHLVWMVTHNGAIIIHHRQPLITHSIATAHALRGICEKSLRPHTHSLPRALPLTARNPCGNAKPSSQTRSTPSTWVCLRDEHKCTSGGGMSGWRLVNERTLSSLHVLCV
jgi:hypothetical protein